MYHYSRIEQGQTCSYPIEDQDHSQAGSYSYFYQVPKSHCNPWENHWWVENSSRKKWGEVKNQDDLRTAFLRNLLLTFSVDLFSSDCLVFSTKNEVVTASTTLSALTDTFSTTSTILETSVTTLVQLVSATIDATETSKFHFLFASKQRWRFVWPFGWSYLFFSLRRRPSFFFWFSHSHFHHHHWSSCFIHSSIFDQEQKSYSSR